VSVALLVIAKAPEPGRSKTRLCPPCTPEQAARLAEASLLDTLESVGSARTGGRRVLVLDGPPGPWIPPGWTVLPQRGGGLDERIANAFADGTGPALLVGMDTPQLTAALVEASASALLDPVDAVLGPASDGGYWAIGLRRPDPRAVLGIPMSTSRTYAAQARRLHRLGLSYRRLPELRDVDTFADALEVAALAPTSRFATTLAGLAGAAAVAGARP
jgi:rSAM/selenodomain-associated transferase 1